LWWHVLVGRVEQVDVRVDDSWVCRRHRQIDARSGVLVVRDLGTKHGTFVNQHPGGQDPPQDERAIGLST
jgi:pSer/pThr/pTyr-binding forkhead associated (FHA) protein